MPEVSVIMSVCDGADFLAEAVDSILSQTFPGFEFIIVDDGSGDDTPAMLDRYAAQDARVRVVTNADNIGLTRSLNLAMNLAVGEYIARHDADDIAAPERFEKQVSLLRERPDVAVVGTRSVFIDQRGDVASGFRSFYDDDVAAALSRGQNPIIHPSAMFRRRIIDSLGGYDESFAYAQDFELWLRVLVNEYGIHNIPEPLQKLRRFSREAAEATMAPAIHARQRIPRLKCIVRIQARYLRYFWRNPGYWYTLITRAARVVVPERLAGAIRKRRASGAAAS